MNLRRLLLPTLPLLLAVGACGDDDGSAAATGDPIATTEVAVVDNAFEPAAIAVDVGATVTWTWEGSNRHDVAGEDFDSEIQRSGAFEHTFHKPGDFTYRCSLHPGMRGRVVVA